MSMFSKGLQRFATDVGNIVRDPIGEIKRGPRGSFGDMLKDEDEGEDVAAPTLSAGEVDPNAELGALQDPRKANQGRLAANLNKASGASILTSP